jgi:hypothetical protein
MPFLYVDSIRVLLFSEIRRRKAVVESDDVASPVVSGRGGAHGMQDHPEAIAFLRILLRAHR